MFPTYCRLLVKFLLSTGVPLFDTLVWGEPLNSRTLKLASRNLKHCSTVRCEMYFDRPTLNCRGHWSQVWRMDERKDGQTDTDVLSFATTRSNSIRCMPKIVGGMGYMSWKNTGQWVFYISNMLLCFKTTVPQRWVWDSKPNFALFDPL